MMKKLIYILLSLFYSMVFIGCIKKAVHLPTVPILQNPIMEFDISESDDTEKRDEELPILFSLNGLYGYLDGQLNVIVPPIYDRAFNYTENGYAWVRLQEKEYELECRILDKKGKIIFSDHTSSINILYNDIISYTSKSDLCPKIIKFLDDTLITNASGLEAAMEGDKIIILVRFTPGIERGFIDSFGNRLLQDLEIKRMSRGFREGRAVIVSGDNWDIHIIDINGNRYGDLHYYRTGRNFSEGLLPAETTDGRTGYITRDGEFAFFAPIVADIPEYDESPLNATDFKGGYALIQTLLDPPTWRIINNQGVYISDELPLSRADSFMNGYSLVKVTNAGYGYINTKGEMTINPIFDDADSFCRGYARIVYEGREGLVNTEGTIFWSDEMTKDTFNR